MYENPDGVKIGLEVHVQLNKLKTKVFCGCTTDYHNDPPNSHVCPVCLGLPGSLPVINKKAVEAAIKVGLALNCKIEEHTQFYRKNYYYPDLPKGFQITQYDFPISSQGYIIIEGEDGELKVRITRAHMEEDPGRLVHEGTIDKSKYTLIDYNRSGMALLEVVSEPDLRSPKEARRYLDKLRNILEYLDVFDGNLEGALRVDANISIMGGQRAEIKNISSHKGAERALLYEIVRQKNVVRRGGVVVQETRHFDEAREITLSMRTKEEAHDYRYFPEPDLVPLKISGWAPAIKETLPELPDARRLRFIEQYSIKDDQAKSLTGELVWADYYEKVMELYKSEYGAKLDPKFTAAWINDYLKGEMNYRGDTLTYTVEKVTHYFIWPEYTVAILGLLNSKKITDDNAVFIFRKLLDTTKGGAYYRAVKGAADTAEKYIMNSLEENGLLKVEGDIVATAAEEAIKENPQAVADFKAGKEKALNSLVGAVMKKTKGRADARTAREILLKKLG
jgi:aspartyl-tRNA(Asn)/glutamyl-tRNA(Gln) amidotransferase subunit B